MYLRVTVLLLRLMLSGVVGLVTAQLWVPHFRRQLLRVLRSGLFHLETSGFLLILQTSSNDKSANIYFLFLPWSVTVPSRNIQLSQRLKYFPRDIYQ